MLDIRGVVLCKSLFPNYIHVSCRRCKCLVINLIPLYKRVSMGSNVWFNSTMKANRNTKGACNGTDSKVSETMRQRMIEARKKWWEARKRGEGKDPQCKPQKCFIIPSNANTWNWMGTVARSLEKRLRMEGSLREGITTLTLAVQAGGGADPQCHAVMAYHGKAELKDVVVGL